MTEYIRMSALVYLGTKVNVAPQWHREEQVPTDQDRVVFEKVPRPNRNRQRAPRPNKNRQSAKAKHQSYNKY